MNLKNIVTWNRKKEVPKQAKEKSEGGSVLEVLPLNNILDKMKNIGEWPTSFLKSDPSFSPKVNVSEDDKQVDVILEIPGMEQKDVNLSLSRDTLMVKGEKRQEKEEKGKDYYHIERTFGSFQRIIPLPCEVDEAKVQASMKNGVLKIKLPKSAKAQAKVKQIEIEEK